MGRDPANYPRDPDDDCLLRFVSLDSRQLRL